ncbi:choline/ethanolamine kinase isoform X2 [Chelonus insularis]|nr:choline/ethanolamine kinase isoform X2 [Chelonus insularis]XP_034933884.1 choline/ethanolamine kinase isoform X2 [Chelonus insularis]XP_034933885.1 choline/ethanolamine kinase isoform X2 [Chelonus insularis]
MSDSNPEMRATAARICRDYLTGVWKHVNAENIGLKYISGGLSNWVYNVQLPDGTTPIRNEPRQVLLRIYGQVHGERAMESIITESVIFTLLSERKLGPKLYGVFPGGRIEEYIPARPLLTKELADPEISASIAEKMARLHKMQVPISKEPTWLWDTMAKWCNSAEDILKNVDNVNNLQLEYIKAIRSTNFKDEIVWLNHFVSQHNYPVVFCHNDLQEGNILLHEKNCGRDLVLIDFEYCSYNYRGFDLANHFIEWRYNYTLKEYPFFYEKKAAGPTDEQKLHFIRSYLKTTEKSNREEELKLMAEVEVLSLASHLLWTLWSVVNAGHSQIPFGYWDYAASRLRHYHDLKSKILLSGSLKDGQITKDDLTG